MTRRITYHVPLDPARWAILDLPEDLMTEDVERLHTVLRPLAMDWEPEPRTTGP